MQYQIFEKKSEIHIDSVISAFELTIGKYGVEHLENMQNAVRIEKIYEVPSKGGIIARFVPHNGPRFIINQGQTQTLADVYIMYLGFDESSKEYASMISDVQKVLG